MEKIFILPEQFKVRGLNKSSTTYFGYKNLQEMKLVDESHIKTEKNAEDLRHVLQDSNASISCSLQLKKVIKDAVSAKLESGKVGSLKAEYHIVTPGEIWRTWSFTKVKHLINPMHLSSNEYADFTSDNAECIEYLKEQVDNFILDKEDFIVIANGGRTYFNYSGSYRSTYLEDENHFEKFQHLIPIHQTPIHYINVMKIMDNSSRFTIERFKKITSWCTKLTDNDAYRLTLNMINGLNLLDHKDVLMTLLAGNYLSVCRKKLERARLFQPNPDIHLFNYAYYTSAGNTLESYRSIDVTLMDYEEIIRQRTSNFKVSPEDMKIISDYFYIPDLDSSASFEIKISPNFVNYSQ